MAEQIDSNLKERLLKLRETRTFSSDAGNVESFVNTYRQERDTAQQGQLGDIELAAEAMFYAQDYPENLKPVNWKAINFATTEETKQIADEQAKATNEPVDDKTIMGYVRRGQQALNITPHGMGRPYAQRKQTAFHEVAHIGSGGRSNIGYTYVLGTDGKLDEGLTAKKEKLVEGLRTKLQKMTNSPLKASNAFDNYEEMFAELSSYIAENNTTPFEETDLGKRLGIKKGSAEARMIHENTLKGIRSNLVFENQDLGYSFSDELVRRLRQLKK